MFESSDAKWSFIRICKKPNIGNMVGNNKIT
jgi:hypothetical protein